MITSNLVERFCNRFKGRYLSINTFKKLDKRESGFHFNGHWNILKVEDDMICHYYMNGATGETGECFSRMKLSEFGKTVFIRYKNSFVLFKRSKGRLKVEYQNTMLDRFTNINDKHIWLHENGIQIKRKYFLYNLNLSLNWKIVDAFTGEEVN
jgi:hypothetical protein